MTSLLCLTCALPLQAHLLHCNACGTPVVAPTQHLPLGTVLQGRYRIHRVLGQGGFGITYAAQDLQMPREVAIKELFPEGSIRLEEGVRMPVNLQQAREAFVQEARQLVQLRHPNIVEVWDVFEQHGTSYMVMELLQGETLGQRLQRQPLTDREVLALALDCLKALKVVHAAGLLHRDIKPDNIFLRRSGEAVLIDFGSARGYRAEQTVRHTRLVTPGYAPPEQYASQAKFGPYTDLYALGAVLYHVLAGEPPAEATDRMLGAEMKNLTGHTQHAGLLLAVYACLELGVASRPQDVAEVSRLLMVEHEIQVTSRAVPVAEEVPAEEQPGHIPDRDWWVASGVLLLVFVWVLEAPDFREAGLNRLLAWGFAVLSNPVGLAWSLRLLQARRFPQPTPAVAHRFEVLLNPINLLVLTVLMGMATVAWLAIWTPLNLPGVALVLGYVTGWVWHLRTEGGWDGPI